MIFDSNDYIIQTGKVLIMLAYLEIYSAISNLRLPEYAEYKEQIQTTSLRGAQRRGNPYGGSAFRNAEAIREAV
jgi:hypothetical protein